MNYRTVNLNEVCRPKQWKTISMSEMLKEGYPLYGANGKIGFYKEYSHEYPTLLITCRGATCGEMNISEPKSYINGNAMTLDNLSGHVELKYLYYYLKKRGFKDIISGSAQPQITRQGLSKVEIPLPPLETQKRITAILDKADELRCNEQKILEKYDQLAQSVFLEMFGDPGTNVKDWPIKQLSELALNEKNAIKAGPFGSSLKKEYYSEKGHKIYGQEQVIRDDFDYGDYYITDERYRKLKNCRIQSGDLLISLVGTFGQISIVPYIFEPGIINPRLMKITLNKKIALPIFIKKILLTSSIRKQIENFSHGGTMGIVNVGIMKKIEIPVPPIILQKRFELILQQIEKQKQLTQQSLQKSEDLFQSLLQRAFREDLFL